MQTKYVPVENLEVAYATSCQTRCRNFVLKYDTIPIYFYLSTVCLVTNVHQRVGGAYNFKAFGDNIGKPYT